MQQKVWGEMNWAYLFALSQFFMAWLLAAVYVVVAAGCTAAEDIDVEDWNAIAASEPFKELLKAKRRFIIPATIFFVIYYFALPYIVGYHPDLMQQKVWGEMNWTYLLALT